MKLLCGDDYGAISLPHGRYADELEFYVKEAGIPPLDVIRWATRNGAELMGRARTSSGRCGRATWPTCSSSTAIPWPTSRVLQDQATAAGRHEGRHARAGRPRSPSPLAEDATTLRRVIIIAGSLSFDPSDRDDVLASLAEVTEASRRDAGCLEYFWGEDLEAPNTFRFFECWESQELLDAHLAQPHEVAFGERNLQRITGATASFFDASATSRAERCPCVRR